MATWCINSEKIIGKNDYPYHFKKIVVRYKRIGYNVDFCNRRHAWLLIQSRLTALLTSLMHDGRSDFRLNDGTILNLT